MEFIAQENLGVTRLVERVGIARIVTDDPAAERPSRHPA